MILVLMQSRSGSSLVASIFHAHGYDCRHSGTVNGHGYCNYEAVEVRKWLLSHKPAMHYRAAHWVDYVPGIDGLIRPNDCVKTGIEYWPIFRPLNMRVFTVRRDPDSIIRSLMEKNPGPDIEPIISARSAMLDAARAEAGGVDIDADQIIAGDFSGIREAFAWHGLPFNEKKARGCVDVSKWHFRKK